MKEVALAKCRTCHKYNGVLPGFFTGAKYECLCRCGRGYAVEEEDIKWTPIPEATLALGLVGMRYHEAFVVRKVQMKNGENALHRTN